MSSPSDILCFCGVLFLFGLLNGFAIPRLRSPRLGLSAHLTAVQSGMFLVVMGLLWPRIDPGSWSGALALLLIGGAFLLWLGILLSAILGTGEALPIAGQGHTGSQASRAIVATLLALGSIGLVAGTGGVLVAW